MGKDAVEMNIEVRFKLLEAELELTAKSEVLAQQAVMRWMNDPSHKNASPEERQAVNQFAQRHYGDLAAAGRQLKAITHTDNDQFIADVQASMTGDMNSDDPKKAAEMKKAVDKKLQQLNKEVQAAIDPKAKAIHAARCRAGAAGSRQAGGKRSARRHRTKVKRSPRHQRGIGSCFRSA